jgi:hypothetical protein
MERKQRALAMHKQEIMK